MMECPDVSYYLAEMIQNKTDPMALMLAAMETTWPACNWIQPANAAEQTAKSAAQRGVDLRRPGNSHGTQSPDGRGPSHVGHAGAANHHPGFSRIPHAGLQQEKTDILDRAIRSNAIVNSLDVRGFYTDSTYDASRQTIILGASGIKAQYDRDADRAQADVLAELASGTGSAFFENSNGLDEGFRRVAAAPEYFYVLGFSPQNLKLDGSFHALQVALPPRAISAFPRAAATTPKHLSAAVETAKHEIEEALFSREEMRDIPVELHTQFFKSTEQAARIALLVRVDVRHPRFRKEDGRNRDDLTVVSGLFDRNGNYVIGNQKRIEMRLRDETLENRLARGSPCGPALT